MPFPEKEFREFEASSLKRGWKEFLDRVALYEKQILTYEGVAVDSYLPGLLEQYESFRSRVRVLRFLDSCWTERGQSRPVVVIYAFKHIACRTMARSGFEEFQFWLGCGGNGKGVFTAVIGFLPCRTRFQSFFTTNRVLRGPPAAGAFGGGARSGIEAGGHAAADGQGALPPGDVGGPGVFSGGFTTTRVQPQPELVKEAFASFTAGDFAYLLEDFKTEYLEVVDVYHQASKGTEIRKAFHAFAKNVIDNLRTANRVIDGGLKRAQFAGSYFLRYKDSSLTKQPGA